MVRREEDRETSMLGYYVIFGTQERRHGAGKREREDVDGWDGREREEEREKEREREMGIREEDASLVARS